MRLWLDPARLAARRAHRRRRGQRPARAERPRSRRGVGGPAARRPRADLPAQRPRQGGSDDPPSSRTYRQDRPRRALVQLGDVGRAELGAEDYSTACASTAEPWASASSSSRRQRARGCDRVKAELARLSALPPGAQAPSRSTPRRRRRVDPRGARYAGRGIVLVILVIFVFLQTARHRDPGRDHPGVAHRDVRLRRGSSASRSTRSPCSASPSPRVWWWTTPSSWSRTSSASSRASRRRHGRRHARRWTRSTGAVVATSLVLVAVFVPVAFFPGRRAASTSSSPSPSHSACSSRVHALTLTPALSALLLRRTRARRFFSRFEPRARAARGLRRRCTLLRRLFIPGAVFAAGLPSPSRVRGCRRFLPDEDQGYFIVQVNAPRGCRLG